jgi:hypothetical protein
VPDEERGVTKINNETWLIDATEPVLRKIADRGYDSLSALERLIRCLWLADYGMRNAGDLATASDRFWPLLEHGRIAATQLGLQRSMAAFSLSARELEQHYFDLFDGVCEEIRKAHAALTGSPPSE